jgi:septal ring factor EnvC (AmiA/AmiB activator)
VLAAARLRSAEAATAEALAKLDSIAARRRSAEQRMEARTEDLAPLLPLIERLSAYPAETLIAVPGTPTDALRGVLVLRGISRQIEHDAEAARAEQQQLDALAQEQEVAAQRLAAAQAEQAAQSAALDQQIADAQKILAATANADLDPSLHSSVHAADQASHAANLRNAIVTLETERQADALKAEQEAARAAQPKRRRSAALSRWRRRPGPGSRNLTAN